MTKTELEIELKKVNYELESAIKSNTNLLLENQRLNDELYEANKKLKISSNSRLELFRKITDEIKTLKEKLYSFERGIIDA